MTIDLDGGVEDAPEADGVLEEAVDVEDGVVGGGVGDVVDVRDHLLAHPRCGASPRLAAGDRRDLPSLLPERAHLSDDHRIRSLVGAFPFYAFVCFNPASPLFFLRPAACCF